MDARTEITFNGKKYKSISSCIDNVMQELGYDDILKIYGIMGIQIKDGFPNCTMEEMDRIGYQWAESMINKIGIDFVAVSDLISAVSYNSFGLCDAYGMHDTNFWFKETQWNTSNVSAEIWANYSALKAVGNEEAIKVFNQIIPERTKIMSKIYKEIFL